MLDALDDVLTAWDKVAALPAVDMAAPELLLALEKKVERLRRLLPAVEHAVLTQLQSQTTSVAVGAKSWRAVLTHRLGISSADATRRLSDAAELGPRQSLTGEALPPALPATAAAQGRGEIGSDHVSVIRSFMDHLPQRSTGGQPASTPKPNWAGWPAGSAQKVCESWPTS